MKLIVGLGNPGEKYVNTKHNIGFDVIDRVSDVISINLFYEGRFKSFIGRGEVKGKEIILLKPTTFVNNSGEAVVAVVRRYHIEMSHLVVICDDFNLDLGRLRIRVKGSDGGHKGLSSIIKYLGTKDFPRFRIGIGSPQGDVVDFVLSSFSKEEIDIITDAVEKASEAVIAMIEKDISFAMNRYNS